MTSPEYQFVSMERLLTKFNSPKNDEELRFLLNKWDLGAFYPYFKGMF